MSEYKVHYEPGVHFDRVGDNLVFYYNIVVSNEENSFGFIMRDDAENYLAILVACNGKFIEDKDMLQKGSSDVWNHPLIEEDFRRVSGKYCLMPTAGHIWCNGVCIEPRKGDKSNV